MADDIESAKKLQKLHPGKITLIRYEDLSLEPQLLTRRLLNFLSLPWTDSISQYLQTHTRGSLHKESLLRDTYGTSRNSSATAFAWRDKMSFSNISFIQTQCGKAMEELGYKLIRSHDDKDSLRWPLEKSLRDVWPF